MIKSSKARMIEVMILWSLVCFIPMIFTLGDGGYGVELTVIAVTGVSLMYFIGLIVSYAYFGSSKITKKYLLTQYERRKKTFDKHKESYLANCKEFAWQGLYLASIAYKDILNDLIEFLELEIKKSNMKLSKISKKRLAFLAPEKREKINKSMKEVEDSIREFKNQIKSLETEAADLESFMIDEEMYD